MRLKSYLLIAGVAATALFGAAPASADDAAEPRPPVDCVGEAAPPQGGPGADGSPCEEDSGLTCEDPEAAESGLPCEDLGDIAPPREEDPEPAPPQDGEETAEEERGDQMTEAEREAIEEAQAPAPVEMDPTYTG
ncbi:hypothetical protein [Nocardiopsis halotolerans]|uniref:hypothetical protein n=1 Tax=Nocardiopsis halotolerans TaxID=124252 RepID=UPI00036CB918|nr:hypothetical protein [Nocardiopsis halotolerans]